MIWASKKDAMQMQRQNRGELGSKKYQELYSKKSQVSPRLPWQTVTMAFIELGSEGISNIFQNNLGQCFFNLLKPNALF